MKKVLLAAVLSAALSSVPVLAQEKMGMPMGEHGGMGMGCCMDKMKDMQGKMAEMKKGMGGMTKAKGMVKAEDMKNMGKSIMDMSGTMGDMGQMMQSGKMTPEETEHMKKMMSDMSTMMTQMSDRMKQGCCM